MLHGGAASRDGRLKTNDQLLSVNGISLLHQSNTAAMETLRTAMLHEEGPVPGAITITVARRNSSPSTSPVQHKRSDSASSHITNSSCTYFTASWFSEQANWKSLSSLVIYLPLAAYVLRLFVKHVTLNFGFFVLLPRTAYVMQVLIQEFDFLSLEFMIYSSRSRLL